MNLCVCVVAFANATECAYCKRTQKKNHPNQTRKSKSNRQHSQENNSNRDRMTVEPTSISSNNKLMSIKAGMCNNFIFLLFVVLFRSTFWIHSNMKYSHICIQNLNLLSQYKKFHKQVPLNTPTSHLKNVCRMIFFLQKTNCCFTAVKGQITCCY